MNSISTLKEDEFYVANYGTEENIEIFKNFFQAKSESVDDIVHIGKFNMDRVWIEDDIGWNYDDVSDLHEELTVATTPVITRENIHLFYEFMSDEDKVKKEINHILDIEFSTRKSKVFKAFFLPSTKESRARADLELQGARTPLKAYDGIYRETDLYCFGVRDTLKPINEYIMEIKNSNEYKEFISTK